MLNPNTGTGQLFPHLLLDLKIPCSGQPGWLSGLVLPSAWVVILESQDRVPHQAPYGEPASPSACVSASLCLS